MKLFKKFRKKNTTAVIINRAYVADTMRFISRKLKYTCRVMDTRESDRDTINDIICYIALLDDIIESYVVEKERGIIRYENIERE